MLVSDTHAKTINKFFRNKSPLLFSYVYGECVICDIDVYLVFILKFPIYSLTPQDRRAHILPSKQMTQSM